MPSKPKNNAIRNGTVVTILSIVLTLVLFELALVLIPRPVASPEHQFWKADPNTGWTHIENSEGIFENQELGFRSTIKLDYEGLRDNENAYRYFDDSILVLGDSVTAGFEVNGRETFSSLLERRLNDSKKKVQVLNGGIRGYGTDQVYWRMKRLLPVYKPTSVIYVFTWNDLYDNLTVKNRFRLFSKPAYTLGSNSELVIQNYPIQSRPKGNYEYVYSGDRGVERISGEFRSFLILDWLRNYSRVFSMADDLYFRYVVGPPTRDGIETIDSRYIRRLLRAILHQMNREAPHFVITSFISDREALNDRLDVIMEVAAEEGIPFIDLRPHFAADPGQIVPNDGHWNRRGHQATANGIYEFLIQGHHRVALK